MNRWTISFFESDNCYVITGLSCLCFLGAVAAQVTQDEEHCVINFRSDDILNVRSKPRSGSLVVVKLRHNECGLIVTGECEGDWCPVDAKPNTGWVHSHYISMVSPSLYCVAGVAPGDKLNLRAWPSPQSKVVKRLQPQQCDISFLPYATNGWQKIRVQGAQGWVNRSFLSGQ